MRHLFRLCFSTPKRALVTAIIVLLCYLIPAIPVMFAAGLMNLVTPIAIPIGLGLIVVWSLRTMFGRGKGRR